MPSLREYTLRWAITPSALRPGQVVMHPGPMNRGVEISDEVADSAASLVTQQVRAGLVVRMAVLYDLLAGRRGGGVSGREPGRLIAGRRRPARTCSCAARACSTPARASTRASTCSCAAADRRARRRRSTRPPASRSIEAAGCTLLPAFIDPHVHLRTPGQEHKEDLATGTARRRRRRLLQRARDAEHRPGGRHRRRCSTRCTSAPRSTRACRVGFLAAISVGPGAASSWRRSASSPTTARAATPTTAARALAPSLLRRALQYAATTGRVLSLHCEDTSLSRAADMHEGAVCARLGLVGYPSIAESTMIARDLRIAPLREPAAAHLPPARRGVGRGGAARAQPGASTSPPRPRRTTCC